MSQSSQENQTAKRLNMESTLALLGAILVLLVVCVLWAGVTSAFVKTLGIESEPIFFSPGLFSLRDIFYAIAIGKTQNKQIPLGVYVHGLLWLAAVVLLFWGLALRSHS